jgi:hypothetical protein
MPTPALQLDREYFLQYVTSRLSSQPYLTNVKQRAPGVRSSRQLTQTRMRQKLMP